MLEKIIFKEHINVEAARQKNGVQCQEESFKFDIKKSRDIYSKKLSN